MIERAVPHFSSRRSVRLTLALVLVTILATALPVASAQDHGWELRACADPFALPFSAREQPGFENRIAAIVADELGADLTYDWIAFSPDMVNLHLRAGTCDVILGVPDGHMDLATTISYYRSPYVFVTRADAPFDIDSLDDPVLADLRIGVQNPGVPPHDALINRGYAANIVGPHSDEPDPPDRVLRQVATGEIDVGVVWGPTAGYFARDADTALRIEPITPQFDPPFLSMSFSMTMGVRPGDDQLRDLLDRAIVARWDDIHAVLAEYGVPVIDEAPPGLGASSGPSVEPTVLAYLGPQTTGRRTNATSLYDLVGDAARDGALLGQRDAPERFPAADVVFRWATTPSAASAERAAERMIATEGADVLIGGVGDDQAATLGRVAAANDMLFLDVFSTDLTLRDACLPTTLHVEASAAAYLDVLVEHAAAKGARSWFLVHEDDEEGRARAAAARAAVARYGGDGAEVIAEATVVPRQPAYAPVFQKIRDSGPDAVLLMVAPADQIAFEGQYRSWGLPARVVPLTGPVAQMRDFLGAERDRTFTESDVVRAVAWAPTRDEGAELSDRFAGRFGQPMQASAFAAYQAVLAAVQAVDAVGGDDADALVGYLVDPATRLASPKGPGVSFRPSDRQLRQPLDLIEVLADAPWRNTLEGKLAIAHHLATVPDVDAGSGHGAAVEELDRYGAPAGEDGCEAR